MSLQRVGVCRSQETYSETLGASPPPPRSCGSTIRLLGWSLAPSNYEGVRVNLDEAHGNGWFLLRLSLHDPLLPLNIESNTVGGAKIIAKELARFIKNYDKLDATKFLTYAE